MLDLSKKACAFINAGLLTLGIATCSSAFAASSDTLTVGVEATYPPMSFRDPASNKSVGVNIDLFEAMGKAMKVKIKFEEMSFEQLTSSLKTGAQMFTTVKNTNVGSTAVAFCGKAIGTPRTTNYYPEVMAWNESDCVKAGKAAATVQGTAGASAARLDLQQERLAAVVLGPEYVKYLISQEPNTYVLIGEPLSLHHFGFAVDKANMQVRDDVAKGLEAIIKDGSYQAVLKKWNLESQAVADVMIDGGK